MTPPVRLSSIRLYPGVDDDLIDWWHALPGNKTEAVKAALRRGIDAGDDTQSIDLAAIRSVIEAALDARLAGLSPTQRPPQSPDETETLLDALGADLLL